MVSKKRAFANRIRDLRRTHKLTQAQLAEKLGVDNTTISKWEADIYEPNSEMLNKLAEFFEKPVDYLLGRSEDSWVSRESGAEYVAKNQSHPIPDPNEPGVQFIMRAKEKMNPKAYEKFLKLMAEAEKAFEDDDE